MIFYGIVVAVIAVAAVAGIMLMKRGKGPKTPRVAAQVTHLSGEQKFCPHCHAVLPMEAAVCSACGKPT
jgi:ribosomal protein L40E